METSQKITEKTSPGFMVDESLNSENNGMDSTEYNKSSIPYDINDFAYSKKNHLVFFTEKFFDKELFGKVFSNNEIGITDYQYLLTYFFILKFIPEGSKILVIGNEYERIFDCLISKNYCTCWKLTNPEALMEDNSTKNLEIQNYPAENEKLNNQYGYFDFIFTVSGLDNLFNNNNESSNRNIIYNLSRLLKFGGYLNLNFTVVKNNEQTYFNNFIFSFYKNYYNYTFPIINYINPTEVKIDKNLFYIEKNPELFSEKTKKGNSIFQSENIFSYNLLLKKESPRISIKTVLTPGDYLKKRPAYFFHHLIKCGGSSLGVVLGKWFNFYNDLYDKVGGNLGFDYDGNVNVFKKYKFNIENLTSDTCIRGHFQHEGIYLHQRYPEIFNRQNEIKIFTFVRDPFKVLISLYYFGRKRKYNYEKINLESFLRTTHNFLAYLLPCNESNYKEVLNRYFFIGIVDKMQESFDKLADLTGMKKIHVPKYNTTDKDEQVKRLSQDFISEIKELNSLDYKIYNYCLDKFYSI